MAFALRKPFKLTSTISTISTISKSTFKPLPSTRAFHNTRPHTSFFTSKPISPASKAALNTTYQNTFKRAYSNQTISSPNGTLWQKLAVGGAMFGGSLIAINLVFNRETREDGGMPAYERAYLNETFMHTGLGVGIIGMAARAMHQSGFVYRIMATNPWVVMIGGLALSFGTMYGCTATPPENYVPKYALWTAFNVTQAAIIAPLFFMASPAVIARAGFYTVAMMGSISFVGATAKQEKYLYIGGPLMAGLAIVIASSFAPLILPATAARTLMWTENISLYGGLAVFGGFTLYDVQKVLHHARLAEAGMMKKDPVNESISLELDFLNIFIRMVQILSMQKNSRK